MRVYNQHTTGALQSHYQFYDFKKFENQNSNFIFIDSPQIFTNIPKEIFDNKIVYLELEEPNRFFVNVDWFHHLEYDKYFNKIFSICPYTTAWHNELYNLNKQHTFIPIKNPEINNSKSYDIIYAGHVFPGEIEDNLYKIKEFNYRVVSNTEHPLTTNKSASHQEKLELISKSKISLIHNLLYLNQDHIMQVKSFSEYQKNEAFSLLDQAIVPQIKGRVFEAALCRSLILCRKDPFNVIEKYFTPDVHFVYYEKENLINTIRDILHNYNDYLLMIENAYFKGLEYTTDAFFEKYLRNL